MKTTSKFPLVTGMLILVLLITTFGKTTNAQEVKIGKQVWAAKNLDVTTFKNGDAIPEAKTDNDWAAAGTAAKPAWCYYNNDAANGSKYGKLYNWYAVTDPRGLAPKGWHIPTDVEWTALTDFLGGEAGGGKLKEKGTANWNSPNNGATNESGFTALPGGGRYDNGGFNKGLGIIGYWWTSSAMMQNFGWYRYLGADNGNVLRGAENTSSGYSVRCIKD